VFVVEMFVYAVVVYEYGGRCLLVAEWGIVGVETGGTLFCFKAEWMWGFVTGRGGRDWYFMEIDVGGVV